MRRSFKYRLWTTKAQEMALVEMLETHRRIYNSCLGQRKTAWETEKKSIGWVDQCKRFTVVRKEDEWFMRTNFSSVQATIRRLDKAFQAFFRRVKQGETPGYPRFKAQNQFDSIEFPSYGDGIRLNDTKLRVQHIGVIRTKLHRPIEGIVKTVSLKREGDKWFAIFSCDLGEVVAPPNALPAVGVDVGLKSFLATSDGEFVANPRFLKTTLPQLRIAGRCVSRKKKGGSNRRKAVFELRNLHAKVANQRRDFHHKTALSLVRRYGFIALEDLGIGNMLKNHRLARSIADAGWYSFGDILSYKAESAGGKVVKSNPRGTSQDCSGCGETVPKLLSERWHSCRCGCELDRDVNAARNILARSQARTEPAKLNVDVSLHVSRSRRLQATE